MSFNVKVSGVWQAAQPWVKVSGTWQSVQSGWVKVSGVWQQFYSSGLFSSTLTSGDSLGGQVGYVAASFGSFSPTDTLNDGKTIIQLIDDTSAGADSYFELFCPTFTNPGASFFSTINGVTSASATYSWDGVTGIARWNWSGSLQFGLVSGVATAITILP